MGNNRNKLFYVIIIVLIGTCIYFAGEKTYYKFRVQQLQEIVDRQASAIETLEKQKVNY